MDVHIQSSLHLSPYRSVSGVSVLVRLLGELGVSPETLLLGGGVSVEDLSRSDVWITPEQELTIIRNVVNASPHPEIGLMAGGRGHVGVNGKLGLALLCCGTPLQAIEMALTYSELTLTFFHHDFKSSHGDYMVTLREIIPLNGLRPFIFERELASIFRMCEDATTIPLMAKEIFFPYPPPSYEASYQSYFHCPVHFNAKALRFSVDGAYMRLPMPKADPVMKNLYEKECRELIKKHGKPRSFLDMVRQMIQSAEGELIDLESLAEQMRMSSRTLRRRLAEEHISFQRLMGEMKKERALSLLSETALTVEAVADRVGYGEAANFYHAFKKWTGKTPKEYRDMVKKTNGRKNIP